MPAGIYNSFLQSDLQNLLKEDKTLSAAIQPALGISGLGSPVTGAEGGFFGFNSLGRVDANLSPDVADLLISARKANSATQQGLNLGNDQALQEALAQRKAGLEGLTAPELQAAREQGLTGIDRQLQTALRGARASSLGSNVEGAVNAIPIQNIAREAIQGRQGLERDLLLANVAERNKRLGEYENLANTISQNQANRSTLAANLRNQSLNTLSNITQGARQDVLNRELFNLNQLAKEKAGQLGLLFGTLGLASQNEAQKNAFDLAKQQLEIARSQAGA